LKLRLSIIENSIVVINHLTYSEQQLQVVNNYRFVVADNENKVYNSNYKQKFL